MLVEHIVLVKGSRPFRPDEEHALISQLGTIPGVLSVSTGLNYTTRALEYTSGCVPAVEA